MRVVCSWCNKVIREGSSEHGVSNGICSECYREMLKELEAVKEWNRMIDMKGVRGNGRGTEIYNK